MKALRLIPLLGLLAFLLPTACKNVPPAPSATLSTEDSTECAELARQVGVLEELVREREQPADSSSSSSSSTPNASGKAECEKNNRAAWDDSIGVCRCTADQELRQANAWSIRNTFNCPDQAQKDACSGVAGSKWNLAIGRCECVNDATKFQANAFSIRNHLKCEGDQGGGSQQGDAVDPDNWWGYDECVAAGGESDYNGGCKCPDGKTPPQFGSCEGEGLSLTQETKPGQSSADANDHDGMLETYRKQLAERKAQLEQCRANASSSAAGQNSGCTNAGGKMVGDTCRCDNGTPVFKLRNETCQQHLAKQNESCANANGLILHDNTCRCNDGTPLFRAEGGKCSGPYWDTGAANQSSDGCTAAGGTLQGGTCKCSNGTPVFKLRNETCEQHLAKQNDSCTSRNGLILHDNTCRCGDGTPMFRAEGGKCDKPYWESTSSSSSSSSSSAGNTSSGGKQEAAVSSRGNCLCGSFQGYCVLYTYDANAESRSGSGKGDNVSVAWTRAMCDEDACNDMVQKKTGYKYNPKYDVKSMCKNKAHYQWDIPNSD